MTWLLPPRLVLACLVIMGALAWLWPVAALLSHPWNYLGIAIALAGLALCVANARRFDRVGTNVNTFRDPGMLVTDGFFAVTRNPMYLGFALFLIGVALALNAASGLIGPAIFIAAAQFWYIPFEERAMQRRFGAAYEAYRRRTRRWL